MTRITTAFLLVLAVGSAGCELATAGEENLVSFRFDAVANTVPVTFDTAIAVGSTIDVLTLTTDTSHAAVAVSGAASESTGVVTVEGTSGNRITLRAVSAGTARITVETANGSDAFVVTTADIARVELKAPGIIVPDNPQSAGVVGGTARFFVTFRDANDKILAGRATPTITVNPPTAASFVTPEGTGFVDLMMNEAGTVTLTPDGSDPLTFEIVAAEAVVALDIRGLDTPTLIVGGVTLVNLRGLTDLGLKVAGIASIATFTSSDSAVCGVRPLPGLGDGVFEIKGLAAGTCTMTAALGDITETHDITVNE